jgi:hypothetical protein
MNARFRSSTHTPFSRLVHGFLLLGWLLSYQGVAPVLMLILDGHHMVKACSSQHGEMRVVLGHETETGQHAGGVLQTSCAMDLASSEAGKPDHVFFFQSVEDASRQMRRLALHLPQVASAVSISCFILNCRSWSKGRIPSGSGRLLHGLPALKCGPAWQSCGVEKRPSPAWS